MELAKLISYIRALRAHIVAELFKAHIPSELSELVSMLSELMSSRSSRSSCRFRARGAHILSVALGALVVSELSELMSFRSSQSSCSIVMGRNDNIVRFVLIISTISP